MLGEQEIVYVVQDEPSMTQDDADKYALYSNILGGYFSNKGKSASQLQADIDYLKKKRKQYPLIKRFSHKTNTKEKRIKKKY